jgi:hypothetical protein
MHLSQHGTTKATTAKQQQQPKHAPLARSKKSETKVIFLDIV